MKARNRYRVVFRNSTVVMDRHITARNMIKAAKKATKIRDKDWPGWSVYSITLY